MSNIKLDSNTAKTVHQIDIISSKREVFVKSFFLFLVILTHFFKKNNIPIKVSFFIKPKKINKFILLRAPFRHKLSKKNFGFCRYNLIVNLKHETKHVIPFSWLNYKITRKFLKFFSTFFESNICSQHKSIIRMYFKKNFNLK